MFGENTSALQNLTVNSHENHARFLFELFIMVYVYYDYIVIYNQKVAKTNLFSMHIKLNCFVNLRVFMSFVNLSQSWNNGTTLCFHSLIPYNQRLSPKITNTQRKWKGLG